MSISNILILLLLEHVYLITLLSTTNFKTLAISTLFTKLDSEFEIIPFIVPLSLNTLVKDLVSISVIPGTL